METAEGRKAALSTHHKLPIPKITIFGKSNVLFKLLYPCMRSTSHPSVIWRSTMLTGKSGNTKSFVREGLRVNVDSHLIVVYNIRLFTDFCFQAANNEQDIMRYVGPDGVTRLGCRTAYSRS